MVACAIALLAAAAVGQNTPAPGPPEFPFTSFVGRLIDSAATQDYQAPNRTLRADLIKIDRSRDRIYMKAGGGYFFAYELSTFAEQSGGALATGAHGERYRLPLFKVNPESPGSGWQTIATDGQERLSDFDFDDRGYVYLAYSLWGFGIVDSQGHLVRQITASAAGLTPQRLVTFASDGLQYLLVSDAQSSVVWNVTDPATPQEVRTIPSLGFSASTMMPDAIALVMPFQTYQIPNSIRIFTPAQLVSSGSTTEIQTHSTGYTFDAVTTDGTKFFAVERASIANYLNPSIVSMISASPSGFTKTEILTTTDWVAARSLTYGSGYLALAGYDGSVSVGVLWRWNGTGFDAFDPRSYLQSYYRGSYVYLEQVVPYCSAESAYAIMSAHGLGDVFALTPAAASCLPGAPQSALATADDGTATVSFLPPASDGGSAITSYIVTSTPGAVTATGTDSPITVSGLANGTTYTFTVRARNAVGLGRASAPTNSATPASTLIPPAIMSATASGTSQVNIAWSAAAKAHHYEVLRSSNGSAFSVVASPAGVAYADTNVEANTTYLYEVRSLDSSLNVSDTTPADPATTIAFANDPLIAGVTISATHFAQLRIAVNAMRAAAGLDAMTFTDGDLSGLPISAVHMTELRSALDDARSALSLPPLSYADPTITTNVTPIRAVHVQQIRDAVK